MIGWKTAGVAICAIGAGLWAQSRHDPLAPSKFACMDASQNQIIVEKDNVALLLQKGGSATISITENNGTTKIFGLVGSDILGRPVFNVPESDKAQATFGIASQHQTKIGDVLSYCTGYSKVTINYLTGKPNSGDTKKIEPVRKVRPGRVRETVSTNRLGV